MADISKNFCVRTITDITQGNAAGEPGERLVAPQDCSRVVIENADANNDMYLQTDPLDASTQKRIPKGNLELDINAKGHGTPIFQAGETIGWLVSKAGAATGPAVITFTR